MLARWSPKETMQSILHAWPSRPAVEATPTPFTKDSAVDDWVLLAKETDIKNFTYADVATGKREQVIDETNKDYVWLSALP
ncbi:hypothetical protein ACHHYP_16935 [Achlya hypogyna]|uniref:Uncharacterized protein n=1 Tax=Achlya hypogyna TaxID=1202772 RepID=A0A1V9ZEB7_ACHHY|nr:hypothetical protein ACHHYP_16935 [Achlya hypogyna]